MALNRYFEIVYQKLLSDKTQKRGERIILVIAIASFLIHLSIIYLVDFGIISLSKPSGLLKNPIAAIYTPFSFILVYEVYLLIYYLPKSFTTYICKQYEIISLIIIRRLFKDLSALSLSSDWFKIKYDLQFTYDLVASVLLYFLIFLFYVQSKKKFTTDANEKLKVEGIASFIKIKKVLAASLVPVIVILAAYSFINWISGTFNSNIDAGASFKDINNIFF